MSCNSNYEPGNLLHIPQTQSHNNPNGLFLEKKKLRLTIQFLNSKAKNQIQVISASKFMLLTISLQGHESPKYLTEPEFRNCKVNLFPYQNKISLFLWLVFHQTHQNIHPKFVFFFIYLPIHSLLSTFWVSITLFQALIPAK